MCARGNSTLNGQPDGRGNLFADRESEDKGTVGEVCLREQMNFPQLSWVKYFLLYQGLDLLCKLLSVAAMGLNKWDTCL